jgi:poly-gamma-glutamate synthesis protein (capsule biosynthesis protein)
MVLFLISGFIVYKKMITLKTYMVEEEIIGKVDKNKEDLDEENIDIIKEPKKSNIKILAVGDIMFHSPQFKAAYNKKEGNYDFTPSFKYIKNYVQKSDLSLANFETVTAGKEIGFHGFPRFNTPKESLLAIKDAGFNILSTANNHSLDQGKGGLIKTIDSIEEHGMKNIGTYKEPSSRILIEEIEGIKMAFLCYTYGMNGMDATLTSEELGYMINKIDEDKIKEDIKKSKELDSDIIIVFIHWGNEYQREPSEYQIDLGKKMIDWGANIILGSHPHVIQRSETVHKDGKDNFIIYSMGNFLSNQRRENVDNKYTEDGVMVQIEIEKDFIKQDTKIKKIYYIPTWIHRYKDEKGLNYEILPIKDVLEGNIVIKEINQIKSRIKESYKDTIDKMGEY